MKASRIIFLIIIAAASVCGVPQSHAGFVELGTSGNYRKTYVTEKNYSVMESFTGSFAYYFLANSAIELSYTQGRSTSVTESYDAQADFELFGLDFILTFAGKDAPFRPYAKVGAAYQKKQVSWKFPNQALITKRTQGISPSAGLGFQAMMTDNLSLKTGIDIWSSPMSSDSTEPTTYDISGRIGLSLMF